MINTIANSIGLHESVYSDFCFDSTTHYSDHAHLAIGVECHHVAPATMGSNKPHCISVSQVSDYSSHCEDWPAENNHRAL